MVSQMLPRFHHLVRTILACPVFLAGVVRGQCLGGGLELASLCHRLFADGTARLGQPEITLGALAPVACAILPLRVGAAAAADVCLTGRTLSAAEARECGLLDDVSEDPEARMIEYLEEHVLPHSASALRCAVRALRMGTAGAAAAVLAQTEALYLDVLVPTRDATEGIRAFLEKRPPVWTNT
jgi:cyclohexa-1,5-dienecarbonyl-CoA hydratase